MSAISLPDAPPILVPITMLPTIVAAGPGSEKKKELRGVNSELTQTGREREKRRQSCVTSATIILFEITFRQTSLPFKQIFL